MESGKRDPNLEANKPVLILVHGIFNRGSIMSSMREWFECRGYRCYVPTLSPLDGRRGIKDMALQLQHFIEHEVVQQEHHRLPTSCEGSSLDGRSKSAPTSPIRLAIIGFSMGGIVARYYLQQILQPPQNLADKQDSTEVKVVSCDYLFTLATPHFGSYWASLPYPSKAFKDLKVNSPLLKALNRLPLPLAYTDDVPPIATQCFALQARLDMTIIPNSSAVWPGAINIPCPTLLHFRMVFDERVFTHIERRITAKL